MTADSHRVYDFDTTVTIDENLLNQLSSLRISYLSLKHCCLSDDHVDALTKLFNVSSLTKLDLSFNAMSTSAIDRILDALEHAPHRLTDLEISGMGTKHQRGKLRLLLLRNRQFNALCDTHKTVPDLQTSQSFCCVACSHIETIENFKSQISNLKLSLETEAAKSTQLDTSLAAVKAELVRTQTELECTLASSNSEIAAMTVTLKKTAADKQTLETEVRAISGLLGESRERQSACESELKTERSLVRESRKSFDKERETLQLKIRNLEDELEETREENMNVRKRQSESELELRKQISDHAAKHADLSSQLTAVNTAKSRDEERHTIQVRALISENTSLSESEERMRRSLSKVQGDLQSSDERIKHSEAETARLHTVLSEKNARLQEISDQKEKLTEILSEERNVWKERFRGLEEDSRGERIRRESASREIANILRSSGERITELLE